MISSDKSAVFNALKSATFDALKQSMSKQIKLMSLEILIEEKKVSFHKLHRHNCKCSIHKLKDRKLKLSTHTHKQTHTHTLSIGRDEKSRLPSTEKTAVWSKVD